ncbi:MAG: DUF3721 domain-containing protein [Cyanobacteriota bacterium]
MITQFIVIILGCHPMPGARSALRTLTAAAPILAAGAAWAQTHTSSDVFATRAAAEKRAQQRKCSGAFAMGEQWMPCQDLSCYEKAISTKK